jgi:autotransporter-associated beta strand protein
MPALFPRFSASALVGWWKFDEGSGVSTTDSSGAHNTGTLVDNPGWVTGAFGDALQMNGSGQYVTVADSPTLALAETINAPLTIEGTGGYSFSNNSASGSGSGSAVLDIGGSITDSNAGNLTLSGTNTNANTLSGNITISSPIVVSGGGSWTLAGANSVGGAYVYSGILNVSSIGASGNLPSGNSVQLGNQGSTTGTLNYTGSSNGTLSGSTFLISTGASGGGGTIESNGSGTFTEGDYIYPTASEPGSLTLAGSGAGVLSGSFQNSDSLGLIMNGTGTWTVSGLNSSLTGATTVNSGTLDAAGSFTAASGHASLNSISGVTVNSGGTLLFGTSDQINHSATASLGGGTLAVARGSGSGFSETMGALTLTAGSTIDFGAYTGTPKLNTLTFASFSDSSNYALSIIDWYGSKYSGTADTTVSDTDNTSDDKLLFSTQLTNAQLSDITFTIGSNTYNALEFANGLNWEIAPSMTAVPEPSTVFSAVCLLGLIGWRGRRRLQELVGMSIVSFGPS